MPRIVKKQRAGALVIAAAAAALALTAALQFRWTGQLSETQRASMETALANSVRQFAREFHRELSYLLSIFRPDPLAAADGEWDRYLERYDEWRRSSDYAPLVSRVLLYLTPDGGAPSLHDLQPAEWRLAAAEWGENLRTVERRLTQWSERQDRVRLRGVRMFIWGFFLQERVFVLPLYSIAGGSRGIRVAADAERAGFLLIEIDPVYMAERMIPEMAARYFSGPDGEELYRIAVVEEGGAGFLYRSHDSIDEAWLRAPDLRALLFPVRRGDAQRGGRAPGGVFNSGLPPRREEPRGREGESVLRRARGGAVGGQASMFLGRSVVFSAGAGRGNRWFIAAKHMTGSLDAAVQLQRRRNLAAGSGVLLLLGAAMAMTVVSARRSRRLADMQMEFVAGVSHELRTPLTVIRAAGDNLASGVVGSGAQSVEYGRLICDQGRRLSQMIEQTLRFAALRSGKSKLKIESVDVAQVVAETLAEVRPVIDKAGFELRQKVERGLPPARADRQALRQSLENLVGNAVKYGAAGRWLEVEAAGAGVNGAREVQIRVRDRGIGIPPQEMENIFEAFYRGAAASAAQTDGSGLGLKLARDMTRGMGGDLTVESKPGRGSTFTIHLPLADLAETQS